jgi:hypothetical protein
LKKVEPKHTFEKSVSKNKDLKKIEPKHTFEKG